jgi:hypothetical protein
MPSHPDRVRRNYCEHEFKVIQGVTVSDMIKFAFYCVKCGFIGKSWFPGIDKEPVND